jgi:hypothetical protein
MCMVGKKVQYLGQYLWRALPPLLVLKQWTYFSKLIKQSGGIVDQDTATNNTNKTIRIDAMKSILTILLWSAMIIALMYGVIAEVGLRELKYGDRRAYIQILEDRAMAEHAAVKNQ